MEMIEVGVAIFCLSAAYVAFDLVAVELDSTVRPPAALLGLGASVPYDAQMAEAAASARAELP
jgi:hypothetical protein